MKNKILKYFGQFPNYLTSYSLWKKSRNIPTEKLFSIRKKFAFMSSTNRVYTANVNRQTTDKLLFSYTIITGENV